MYCLILSTISIPCVYFLSTPLHIVDNLFIFDSIRKKRVRTCAQLVPEKNGYDGFLDYSLAAAATLSTAVWY